MTTHTPFSSSSKIEMTIYEIIIQLVRNLETEATPAEPEVRIANQGVREEAKPKRKIVKPSYLSDYI